MIFQPATRAVIAFRLPLLIVLVTMLAQQAVAQQPETPVDAETIRALIQRVKDLESEVSALKSQMPAATVTKPPAAPEAAANQPTSAQQTPVPEETAVPEPMDSHSMDASGPRLRLRGYGDVGWNASDAKGSTNSFALGQLNLFLTSQLTDKVSFLAEIITEADQGTNEFSIEPERLELIYNASDLLNLSVGRFHTGIGYYNTAYHHSALMQTTLGRPFLFQFEDNGGILPVHSVGVSATGTISNRFGLHYVAEIGNGRSPRKDVSPVQNVTDDNNGKAFNLALFVRPQWLPGLQFGMSAYHDHVTPPAGTGVKENISAAHVVYQNSRFEFLNEAVWLRHSPDQGNFIVNIPGFYSQISKRFGNYRPYFRYEYLNVPARDPLYSDVGLLHGPKIGVRYDLSEFSAFKVEYGRDMRRSLNSVNTVGAQLSFAF
ncbi:MAG: hypothetical protein WA738_04195 [Candidatus Angelobacter sp.]